MMFCSLDWPSFPLTLLLVCIPPDSRACLGHSYIYGENGKIIPMAHSLMSHEKMACPKPLYMYTYTYISLSPEKLDKKQKIQSHLVFGML